MYYLEICPLGGISGKKELLTYSSASMPAVGSIVEIPFGAHSKLGVVISQTTKPDFATKAITMDLGLQIPAHLVELSLWISEYYVARLTTVLQSVIPRGVAKKRHKRTYDEPISSRANNNYTLNDKQQSAVDSIIKSSSITHLLHGVTGSGKTRVYQSLSQKALQANKSVLILVPEISLTPQLAAEFTHLHQNVMVLHSGQTEAERHSKWEVLLHSKEPWVVIGPRSALFSPLKSIGIIVIDECHEPSYQQDAQPKYSALRVARKLAGLHADCKLILGSATPLVTDYYIATHTKTPIVHLPEPTMPRNTTITLVDIKEKSQFGRHYLFSKTLLDAMHKSIVQNQQIMLFHNRRGTARISICGSCGWVAECTHCHIPMRLHHDTATLQCHTCGIRTPLPQTCPKCSHTDITFQGFGSKRIENEVQKLFPESSIARFDSDTPARQQLHHRYQELYDNSIQIIIGTQGITKGLDIPNLSVVGVVQADSELFIPDFSSSERAFQLLTQVIGRAGRSGQESSVIIQAINPDHPAITHAVRQDYASFYNYEIAERKQEYVSPFRHMLHVTVGYASQKAAQAACEKLITKIKTSYPEVMLRGPAPAFHEKRGNQYYWQVTALSSSRSKLVSIAAELPSRFNHTLDPLNLL